MSYRDVLKIFKLERELSDDESALLNTLRGMSDTDRELLAETLGPPVKGKVGKTAKTTRTFEKCEVCNYSRRAAVHKDSALDDYHEFVSAQARGSGATEQKKSKRASELAGKVKGAVGARKVEYGGFADDTDIQRCAATVDDNGGEMKCGKFPDDNIHHLKGHPDFHPFVSSSPVHPAVGQSSTSGSEVSSETGLGAVSSAVGGGGN